MLFFSVSYPVRFLLLPLALAFCLTGCVQEPEPRLRVGTFPRPAFDPLFLARSLGWYNDERLNFIEFPSASEMLIAYRNGALDAATVTMDDAIRLAADGEDPRIVLLMARSMAADAILAKPDVPDLGSLKGRTVAVESNSLGAYVLARALDAAGVPLGELRIISCRADRMERDLALGKADAFVAYEPYRTKLLLQDLLSIYDTRVISPWEVTGMLIVPKAIADKPPASLYELADGWFRALDYLRIQRSDAVTRMAGREGLTARQFTNALKLLKYVDRKENLQQLGSPSSPFSERLLEVAAFMRKKGMLEGEVNLAPLRSDVLLREEP